MACIDFRFPEEVVVRIFAFLDLKSIAQLTCVCKQWCDVAKKDNHAFWTTKCTKDFGVANYPPNASYTYDDYEIEWKIRYWSPRVSTMYDVEISENQDNLLWEFCNGVAVCGSLNGRNIAWINLDTKDMYPIDNWSPVDCITQNGKRVFVGYRDSIREWDLKSKDLKVYDVRNNVTCLACDQVLLAAGVYPGWIDVWNIGTCDLLYTLHGHFDWVSCIQMDETRIMSGSWDKTLIVWDKRTGECLETIQHDEWVLCIRFNARVIVSGARHGVIRVWNSETYEQLATIDGHFDNVSCLFLDERRIISGSIDGSVKVWDLRTLECLNTLQIGEPVSNIHGNGRGRFFLDSNSALKMLDFGEKQGGGSLELHGVMEGCTNAGSSDR